jgi:hypothetical protein
MSFILIMAFLSLSTHAASDIILSSKIKLKLRKKITQDLAVLDTFPFRSNTDLKTLRVLGIADLTTETASTWLNDRVKYIVEEKLVSKKSLSVEQENVDYPSPLIRPFSDYETTTQAPPSLVTMTNIGSAFYIQGKSEHKLFALKVSQPFPKKSIQVRIDSPRAGIIQIGAGLFAPELAINRLDDKALANSIFRLVFFFHEARHADGNAESLGFTHSICPKGHDYQDEPACDESLNGAYSVGAVMARELMLSCDERCSERDKEMLKLFLIDNYNRIQTKTHLDTNSKYWDPQPEKL